MCGPFAQEMRKAPPEESRRKRSVIGRLALPMLGPRKAPALHAKSMASRAALSLAVDLVREHAETPVAPRVALLELQAVYDTIYTARRAMSDRGVCALQRHMSRFRI